ncbi:MAG: glutamine--tRNA ligase/YqeY domain fusion protein [Spongiibacteraceae bacterium]|jgi:glutaminyl-tRNA synthetase|nr:glutamine--tRNA ligase/YqeY domain fusion protein [Spongiibacteraceae bacterium]
MSQIDAVSGNNFLRSLIARDLEEGRIDRVVTRFPPEPNGYLHVGHAKSICLNFGLAEQFGGACNLRFDDTNPAKEEQEYIDAIKEDVRWLGFRWDGQVRYASDYFGQLYEWAQHLIRAGKAYVCDLSPEQASEYRGWATSPGKDSPYRERSVEENLALLERMRAGEFDEGHCTLRAKIDMASPNMNLRDPILYRIRKQPHHQTGDTWCIYPSYDYAHGQGDAIEGVTHSICTLEFQDHRPLYDWLIENLPVPHRPRQYEFGRLNLSYTVTSKRKLKRLVDEGIVSGWDDPRMPTLTGMRRRGYTPRALRHFCEMIGVTRSDGVVEVAMLEHAIRDDLNENAPRAMCVLNPLKVVITNFVSDEPELMVAPAHPNKPELGQRELPFTREIMIDQADFSEDTTLSRKKFKRLVLGDYVRLRSAYVIRADEVIRDDTGAIAELRASLVPGTVGDDPPEGIRPRGVIHWVSASHGKRATVRLYEHLFNHEAPDKGDEDFFEFLNPDSLTTLENCWVEPALAEAAPEQNFQFEREGYFVADRHQHCATQPVFNKTIGLSDSKGK